MTRLRRGAILALLALLLALPGAAGAANPFGRPAQPPPAGAPAPGGQAPAPERSMAPSGFFAPVTYFMLSLQREMTRSISRQLRAIRDGEPGGALFFAAVMGLLYGSLHTLGPGHGKFVVMTYFLSRDAKPWRGFLMGGQIALFHVLSAIALLWMVDLVARKAFGMPAGEIRAVQQASYASIALIGLYMAGRALRSLMRNGEGHRHDGHDHGHEHGHSHSLGQEGLLSLFVGLVPCTGAILVMLYALANNIVLAGIVVVAAIGAGMALTMAGIGLLGMVARSLVLSRLEGSPGRGRWAAGAVQLAGGAAITAIGAAYFLSSL
ncbi:MAG: hypothetical protein HYZ11_17305 [Candidatus Tectomicrobia bacterium]|uniref:Nickel/cobalt efflux system n=1 Tax=Tectimicrobiota bacterium TaxID=2528274 RepID=A0A932MP47_UNCTE|nr:hypothetical protein [Candidatus Tectomicrobia bacterium]